MFVPDHDGRPARSIPLRLLDRFPWLSASHPIVARETKFHRYQHPPFIRKLSDPWSMLGYAAILHGCLFFIAILSVQHLAPSLTPVFLPFLTPFGTLLTFAMLHSILYWTMLIGVSHFTLKSVGQDLNSGTWQELRLTALRGGDILKGKVVAAFRSWWPTLRILALTRMLGLLIVPLAAMVQQQYDRPPLVALNFVGAMLFIVQPFVDAFMVCGLSALSVTVIRSALWAKVGAYALGALAYGLLSGLSSLWLMFKTPMGAFAALFIPLGHWTPLVGAMVPSVNAVEFAQRMALVTMTTFVLPLIFGFCALGLAYRRTRG